MILLIYSSRTAKIFTGYWGLTGLYEPILGYVWFGDWSKLLAEIDLPSCYALLPLTFLVCSFKFYLFMSQFFGIEGFWEEQGAALDETTKMENIKP